MLKPNIVYSINAIAGIWSEAMSAALLQGFLAILFISLVWATFRHYLSHAFTHALFLFVPLKIAAAALFVVWPVVISFQIPLPYALYELVNGSDPLEITENTVKIHQVPFKDLTDDQESVRSIDVINRTPTEDVHFEFNPGEPAEAFLSENQLPSPNQVTISHPVSSSSILMALWAMGFVVLFAVFSIRQLHLIRRLLHSNSVIDEKCQLLLKELAASLKLRRIPRLTISPHVACPAVTGLIRPQMIVQEGFFENFQEKEIQWALLHELAHIKRFDLWTLSVERLIGLIFYFHPAIWISRRVSHLFRELACDDMARMKSGLSPRVCAEAFLKIVVWASRPDCRQMQITPELNLTDRYPSMKRRIMNMTETNQPRRHQQLSLTSALILTGFALLLSLPVTPQLVAETPISNPEVKYSITEIEDDTTAPVVSDISAQNEKTHDTHSDLTISNDSRFTIGGKLIDDATGKAIQNAEIRFAYIDSAQKFGDQTVKTSEPVRTDAEGRFQLNHLPSDYKFASVQIVSPGYASKRVRFERQNPNFEALTEKQAVIRMKPGQSVQGKVIGTDGRPVPNAMVHLSPSLYANSAHKRTTDEQGRFSFDNLDSEAPSHVLYATKQGMGTATFMIRRPDSFPDEIVLQMETPEIFKAMIVDEQGKALADVYAELRLFGIPNGEFRMLTKSDREGRIVFRDLPQNKDVMIDIYAVGYASGIHLEKAGDFEEKKYTLLKSVNVSGTVLDTRTNQPIDHFKVEMAVENERNRTQTSNEFDHYRNGRFQMSSSYSSPERFRLTIQADGYRPFESRTYTLAECPLELEVKLDPIPASELPRYRGRVLSSEGKPVNGAAIGILTETDFSQIEDGKIGRTLKGRVLPVTNPNGEFEFSTTEPVKEIIAMNESGVARQILEFGKSYDRLELKLGPYGRLVGSLKRDGKPDLKSNLLIITNFRLKNYFGPLQKVKIDDAGNIEVDQVIPGEIQLHYEWADIPQNGQINLWNAILVKPGETVRIDKDLTLADVPRRDVIGKIRFSGRPVPASLSESKIQLRSIQGNPLRLTQDQPYLNSPSRLQYLQTPEGKKLGQALDEFLILKKEMTPEGMFRIEGLPEGTFELVIEAGNSNSRFGYVKKVIQVTSVPKGKPVQPIDLGELTIESPTGR